MSGFSKTIESILKSFSKPAQKQAGEISAQHATKASNANKDNQRLQKRSDDYPLAERTTSAQPHSAQEREGNRPNGENTLSKDNQSNSSTNQTQNTRGNAFW